MKRKHRAGWMRQTHPRVMELYRRMRVRGGGAEDWFKNLLTPFEKLGDFILDDLGMKSHITPDFVKGAVRTADFVETKTAPIMESVDIVMSAVDANPFLSAALGVVPGVGELINLYQFSKIGFDLMMASHAVARESRMSDDVVQGVIDDTWGTTDGQDEDPNDMDAQQEEAEVPMEDGMDGYGDNEQQYFEEV